MPMLVTALGSDRAYLAILFRLLASLSHGEPVPALTSDPAYPAILFPVLGEDVS